MFRANGAFLDYFVYMRIGSEKALKQKICEISNF